MKKVLYVLFGFAPSTVVRATVFSSEFSKGSYRADYFQLDPHLVQRLEKIRFGNPLLRLALRAVTKLVRMAGRGFRYVILFWILRQYEGVIFLKYSPAWLLRVARLFTSAKFLYDFDDAVWLPEFFGEDGFLKIVRRVDFVSTDNKLMLDVAIRQNPNVFIVDGPAQLELYDHPTESPRRPGPVVVGWLGSPSTLFYIRDISARLQELWRVRQDWRLKLIGTGSANPADLGLNGLPVQLVPFYDQKSMAENLLSIDIGLFPLRRDDLSLYRGSLKARVYMAARVAVVGTAFGENLDLIQDGENGILVQDDKGWVGAISRLLGDPSLLAYVRQRGLETVRKNFSVEACFNQLEQNYLRKL